MPRTIFGRLEADDIFISYARRDGEQYMKGLDTALMAQGFACFTDHRGTDANARVPKSLLRKVGLCKTLVLVGTPSALETPQNIAPEVAEFARANGTSRIVCISFDQGGDLSDWSKTPWFEYVQGKTREREVATALVTGEPSAAVIDAVVKAANYMKAKDRLRRYRNQALGALLLLLVAGVLASVFAWLAVRDGRRQQAIADSRRLANRAQTLLRERPDSVLGSLTLAESAMTRAMAVDAHTVEADEALRTMLALLPRRLVSDSTRPVGGDVQSAALSPDGRHIGFVGPDHRLRIYDARSATPLSAQPPLVTVRCDCSAVALASGLTWAAAVSEGGIAMLDLRDSTRRHVVSPGDGISPGAIALSPRGRYVALYFTEGEDVGTTTSVRLLDAQSGRAVATITDLDMLVQAVAFGPNGNLAVGGRATVARGGRAGMVALWPFSDDASPPNDPDVTPASLARREVVPQSSPVTAIAPGIDGVSFATNDGLWHRSFGGSVYERRAAFPLAAEVPGNSSIGAVALDPASAAVTIVRSFDAAERNLNAYDATFREVWELEGHRDRGHVFLSATPAATSLTPDAAVVRVRYEDGSGSDVARAFRLTDGVQVDTVSTTAAPNETRIEAFDGPPGYAVTVRHDSVVVRDVWARSTVVSALRPTLTSVDGGTISPGGRFLALRGMVDKRAGTIVVYRLRGERYEPVATMPHDDPELENPGRMALSADGARLAVVYAYSETFGRVWDVGTGRDVSDGSLEAFAFQRIALGPRGSVVVATEDDGTTQLVDLTARSKKPVRLLDATTIQAIAFSVDDRYVALGAADGVVHVFDTRSADGVIEIARLLHTGGVVGAGFSDDGRYLVTASSDPHPYRIEEAESHAVRVWLLRPTDLVAEATARAATITPRARKAPNVSAP